MVPLCASGNCRVLALSFGLKDSGGRFIQTPANGYNSPRIDSIFAHRELDLDGRRSNERHKRINIAGGRI